MNPALESLRQSWQEALAPLQQRWAQLQPREQRVLTIAGVLLVLLLLVYGLWLPSRLAAQKAESSYAGNRALLLQLQQQGPAPGSNTGSGGSLLRTASDAAARINLGLTRIEPEGDGRVRVWMEKADFNTVAAWLASLSAQGVKIDEAQVEKQSDGGVSARFALSR